MKRYCKNCKLSEPIFINEDKLYCRWYQERIYHEKNIDSECNLKFDKYGSDVYGTNKPGRYVYCERKRK